MSGEAVAFFSKSKNEITFNVMRITKGDMRKPVSKLTSLILHEMGHTCGDGHDSVYDHQFERLVNEHTCLLASEPEKYREFEPDLFPALVNDEMLTV